MNIPARFLILIILMGSVLLSQTIDTPTHSEIYLGDNLLTDSLQLFAPGIISTNMNEDGGPIITPDGKEVFWRIGMAPYSVILYIKEENGKWSKPKVAPFSGQYSDGGLTISPDGKKIFFSSKRPIDGTKELQKFNTWVTEKENGEWLEPVPAGYPIDDPDDYYTRISLSCDGTIIKQSKTAGKGGWDLFALQIKDDKYTIPSNLSGDVNTRFNEYGPAVSPDGSYIIFQSDDRPENIGSIDLYVSFKLEEGGWSQGINLGEKVNSEYLEHWPGITCDGKYLFFSSDRPVEKTYTYSEQKKTFEQIKALHDFYYLPRNGGDYYWISTKFIKNFKPNG